MRLWWHIIVCWCLLLCIKAARGDETGFCLQGARNLASTAGALFGKASRTMPPLQPVLAVYDWDLSRAANSYHGTSNYTPCHKEAPIFRYKVLKGILYCDHDHDKDGRYKPYRMAFLEMLTLAMYIYKDFPDVDLVVDFTDHPQLCDQDIPFLRYSILNASLLLPKQQYNLTELLAPAWVTPDYAAKVKTYTKGFTIPSPEAWRDLSLTQDQLADFIQCMDITHPWPNKRRVVFWRGQATGCSRGWPQAVPRNGAQPASAATGTAIARPHILRNKRVQMALRLFPYGPAAADVGITSLPQLTPECLGGATPRQRHRRHHRRQPLLHQVRQAGSSATITNVVGAMGAHASRGYARHLAWPWHQQSRPRLLPAIGPVNQGSSATTAAAAAADNDVVDQRGDSSSTQVGSGSAGLPLARGYKALAAALHKEAVGLEGWADAVITLSIDGYGPPFRLPQQLLLGSAVLRMSSPYQTWLDHHLVPGTHLQEFAYDLINLEQQVLHFLNASSDSIIQTSAGDGVDEAGSEGAAQASGSTRHMAAAARTLVADRVNIVSQLDAFAWSVARYKQVCKWEVVKPAADDPTWRFLQLDAGFFQSKGVPETAQLQVMQYLHKNFQAALKNPAIVAAIADQPGV